MLSKSKFILAVGFASLFCLFGSSYLDAKSISGSRVSAIYKEVSSIRSLSANLALRVLYKSKKEIRAYVLKRFKEEYRKNELELERITLVKLGLLPPDFPYKKFLLKFLTSEVAGYYDPYEVNFNLASWIPLELLDSTIAHELVHLLQDANFGLKKFLRRDRDNDDKTQARNALIEGDATKVMIDYMLGRTGKKPKEILDKLAEDHATGFYLFGSLADEIPNFLKEALIFPYISGYKFVSKLKEREGWKSVNKAYVDQPLTTEQIMHPEKYPEEKAKIVKLKSEQLRKRGFRPVKGNVFGELLTYLWLKSFLEEDTAREAAEGWGGDSYRLFRSADKKSYALLAFYSWDSIKDSEQFFSALKEFPKSKDATKGEGRPESDTDKDILEWTDKDSNTANDSFIARKTEQGTLIGIGFSNPVQDYIKTAGLSELVDIKS